MVGGKHYNQYGGALQPPPWGRNEVTPINTEGALREVYNANQAHILENHCLGPVHSVYNFPVTNDVNLDQLMRIAQDIYHHQQRAFRLNLVFGTILQNRETGRYRYFVPYNNSGIFERHLYISRRTICNVFVVSSRGRTSWLNCCVSARIPSGCLY